MKAMNSQQIALLSDVDNKKREDTVLPESIGALFDHAVSTHSSKILWQSVDSDETISYEEFSSLVDRCMTFLHEAGVRHGTHVGTMLPNVPALGVTWMALAKLGAVMLPVNTHYKSRELAAIVEQGEISILVIDEAYLDLLYEDQTPLISALQVIVHGTDERRGATWHQRVGASDPYAAMLSEIGPQDIMTIQFTSGSTGLPKGCMLSHEYWTTIAYVRSWQGPICNRMLIDMPFHYMGGQWRFLMALVLGATACVALRPTIKEMIDRLVKFDIDFCSVSPLLAKLPPNPRQSEINVKWAGTMALPADLHVILESRLNGAPAREMYGLTETGATLAMPYSADSMVGSGMIGLPTPFRKCRIVDENGVDVERGQSGELWVAGRGLMSGYFKRPEANEKAWSHGWFKTGDLFVQDEDGYYKIVGRIKDVIRRSGENISATEVEYIVSAMPEVEDVAAVAVPDLQRGEELKIFVVLCEGQTPENVTPHLIRDFCADRLAAFKVPRYVAYLDGLPKTASGKTAKSDLAKPTSPIAARTYDFVDRGWM